MGNVGLTAHLQLQASTNTLVHHGRETPNGRKQPETTARYLTKNATFPRHLNAAVIRVIMAAKEEAPSRRSVAELAGRFKAPAASTDAAATETEKPVRRRPPRTLQLTKPPADDQEAPEVTSPQPGKVKRNSALIEKLQANLALSPTALLPSPKSPGFRMLPAGFVLPAPVSALETTVTTSSTATPTNPVSLSPATAEELPTSFEEPPTAAEGSILPSINKGRARHSIRRRPPSRRHRKTSSEDDGGVTNEGEDTTPTSPTEPTEPNDKVAEEGGGGEKKEGGGGGGEEDKTDSHKKDESPKEDQPKDGIELQGEDEKKEKKEEEKMEVEKKEEKKKEEKMEEEKKEEKKEEEEKMEEKNDGEQVKTEEKDQEENSGENQEDQTSAESDVNDERSEEMMSETSVL
ncbi:duboraya [Scomber japonicus]|uniref:duboraya n=1 Tax=Scomber japonicus TaxID=13676 RepID=UPI0023056801|nr:duboraya [Scomber japonicus]